MLRKKYGTIYLSVEEGKEIILTTISFIPTFLVSEQNILKLRN